MSLYDDIERQCHAIRHLDPADVDLEDVRVLLRRCQRWMELVEETVADGTISVQGSAMLRLVDEAVT